MSDKGGFLLYFNDWHVMRDKIVVLRDADVMKGYGGRPDEISKAGIIIWKGRSQAVLQLFSFLSRLKCDDSYVVWNERNGLEQLLVIMREF